MAHMDIFKDDAFSAVELTTALNKVPFKPQALAQMGIFTPKPIRLLDASFEKKDGKLTLVSTSERGSPLEQAEGTRRDIRAVRTHRVAKGDKLRADEIQGVRAFGSETELEQMQAEVMARMISLRDDIELTHENMRLGAINGLVIDADGTTVLNDWFDFWGIAQPAEIDFDLDNANPASGAVKKLCNQVIRAMAKAGKGAFTPGTRIGALCGDAFYDDLTTHKEIVATYLNQQAANELRGDAHAQPYESFRYGNITWINYRGTDDGTVGVSTDKCRFFPIGAKDVFQHVMSPGESFDFVNTPGQPHYSIIVPDRDRNQFVQIEDYSYPLFACTRPEMLLRAKRT